MPSNLRFIFDTNVIVSAVLLKQSTARRAFDKALEKGTLVVSQVTVQELNGVLHRPAFDQYVSEEERIEFLTALVREASLIEVTQSVTESRDPKDDKFLELAISAQATCIVSGDKDLLILSPFRDIPIMTPREFVDHPWEE